MSTLSTSLILTNTQSTSSKKSIKDLLISAIKGKNINYVPGNKDIIFVIVYFVLLWASTLWAIITLAKYKKNEGKERMIGRTIIYIIFIILTIYYIYYFFNKNRTAAVVMFGGLVLNIIVNAIAYKNYKENI